jgi:hypothetical protein
MHKTVWTPLVRFGGLIYNFKNKQKKEVDHLAVYALAYNTQGWIIQQV